MVVMSPPPPPTIPAPAPPQVSPVSEGMNMTGLPPLNLDLSAGPSNAQGGGVGVGGVTFGDFNFKSVVPSNTSWVTLALIAGAGLIGLRIWRT